MTLNGVMALFCVISANSGSFRAQCVEVHVRYLISWWVLVIFGRPFVQETHQEQRRNQEFDFGGLKPMASAERKAITGVWEQSPQRGPGAEPLVRGSGGRSPPEAESFFVDVRP